MQLFFLGASQVWKAFFTTSSPRSFGTWPLNIFTVLTSWISTANVSPAPNRDSFLSDIPVDSYFTTSWIQFANVTIDPTLVLLSPDCCKARKYGFCACCNSTIVFLEVTLVLSVRLQDRPTKSIMKLLLNLFQACPIVPISGFFPRST